MADFTKFRTSIGGFNRDDVVHYIETTSVEHLKELRQVKDANEKLEAEKAALRAELDETKKKLTAANAKLDRMTVEDASLQQQVETLAQEAAELAQRAADAEARAEAEKQAAEEAMAAAPQPTECASEAGLDDAEAPEEAPVETAPEKNYTEEELEAYRRAEAMERNALVRAQRLKEKLSQLCQSAHTRYTDSGGELEALTQDLSSVLSRMQDTIADLQVAFDETEEAFEDIQTLSYESVQPC